MREERQNNIVKPCSNSLLLRLVRDDQFEVSGAAEPELCQARVTTATTADLHHLEASKLDPALYYALSIAESTLPALKSRSRIVDMLIGEQLPRIC